MWLKQHDMNFMWLCECALILPKVLHCVFINFSYEEAFYLGVEISMKYLQESRRKFESEL